MSLGTCRDAWAEPSRYAEVGVRRASVEGLVDPVAVSELRCNRQLEEGTHQAARLYHVFENTTQKLPTSKLLRFPVPQQAPRWRSVSFLAGEHARKALVESEGGDLVLEAKASMQEGEAGRPG